jgi:hypothetical protein
VGRRRYGGHRLPDHRQEWISLARVARAGTERQSEE